MNECSSAKELLLPPTEKAAFSDHQAYVRAELSRLAYSKFEGRSTVENIAAGAKTLLMGSPSLEHDSKNTLREILGQEDFELVKTFSAKGTQAFICLRKIAPKSGGKEIFNARFPATGALKQQQAGPHPPVHCLRIRRCIGPLCI